MLLGGYKSAIYDKKNKMQQTQTTKTTLN